MVDTKFLGGCNRRDCIALVLAVAYLGLSQAAQEPPPTILVVGDSLSAEYGLKRGTGWVALLVKKLADEKITAKVVNASISGDTSSGGRSRFAPLLAQHKPTQVILELGANDALRGLPLKQTQDNLGEMVQSAQMMGAQVIVVGIQVPPNFGAEYMRQFAGVFEKVAKAHKAPLVPFLLKGVADVADSASLFQADRIHPNEQAQAQMMANVWPTLKPLLGAKSAR
jgi:acyl-CoA thioesterase I